MKIPNHLCAKQKAGISMRFASEEFINSKRWLWLGWPLRPMHNESEDGHVGHEADTNIG